MNDDLHRPWDPAAAYQHWLRATLRAGSAELGLAHARMAGRVPSDHEVARAAGLREAADALRNAAQHALHYLDVPVQGPPAPTRVRYL